jgi:ATP-binding cassette subfamily C protein
MLLSAVLNVLLLSGSLYMMIVYDTVLPSRNLPSLFGLLGLMIVAYLFQAVFDAMRSRILADIGSGMDRELAPRVQSAMSSFRLRGGNVTGDGLTPMRDLDQVRGFLCGPGPATLMDLPWVAFFLAVLAMLHVWLGITAIVGVLILVWVAFVTDRVTNTSTQQLTELSAYRSAIADDNLRHVEIFKALGMTTRLRDRWISVNTIFLGLQDRLTDRLTLLGGASKVFRMFLQSAMLTVGAWLVIDGKASAGIIFASSILSGRALAPIDTAIANWRSFVSTRASWRRLDLMFGQLPPDPTFAVALPKPHRDLLVEHLVVAPPGGSVATLQGVTFLLNAGDALGIIGSSASGKTTLAKAILGLWRPSRGAIRIDGAEHGQWDADDLGESIGYLPQAVELLEGTVAENISRFATSPSSAGIIAASRAAAVHDLIVKLPDGYATQVGSAGTNLSAGQRQRIGLARALYNDPFLVVLDEPNSNLDAQGEQALEYAIAGVRARGGIVLVIAHRPSALAQASHILVMQDGRQEIFGSRDEVLAKMAARSAIAREPAVADRPMAVAC